MSTNDYDFGFSFTSDEPVAAPAEDSSKLKSLEDKIDAVLSSNEESYKAKLKEVEGLILPLLVNLMKNPEKPYIKWENRTEVIQKQIDKILAITRG
jgi:hypothetical protein